MKICSVLYKLCDFIIPKKHIVCRLILRKYCVDIVLFFFFLWLGIHISLIKANICTGFDIGIDYNYAKLINSALSFVATTYSISFISLFVHTIMKEAKKYKDMFPHIQEILRKILSFYNEHVEYLRTEFNDALYNEMNKSKILSFSFIKDNFDIVVSYTKGNETAINNFCNHNHGITLAINNNIESLLKYSDCIDSKILSILYYILDNQFIVQNRTQQHQDLSLYECFLDAEISLYKLFIQLKNEVQKTFGKALLVKGLYY